METDVSPRQGIVSRVYHGLIQHDLLGGVPKRAAVLNGTLTLALVQATLLYWLLLVAVVLHVGAMMLTKRDPLWMVIWVRYLRTYRTYEV